MSRSTPYGRRLLAAVPELDLRRSLAGSLASSGYVVEAVDTGAAAVGLLGAQHYDLLIVDVDIPDLLDLADHRPALADKPPILCVTWCESLDDLVPEIGAEVADYVTKPCRAAELLARVEVLLRARDAVRDPVLRHGDLLLDEVTCQAWRGDRPLEVTAAEYRLLRYLLHNAGRVLSKDQVAWQVWGEARGSNAIERLMSRLRHKVDLTGPALIRTRRGFGYLLGE
ncbi:MULTISPECIES: response regulator transcription factor [Catenuloplanes]|uniref:DNA-binding response OmpR family regulator n=1 Tax=Catenuloplanes niger TaxID=587534 RepID=A0AAE4CRY5_9ACTN|nr:response regulator transcription factor [Catenuloplanes niger]MDR7320623.1 DNA-binding response OmpR family regulator [Catenuloplanes niger]